MSAIFVSPERQTLCGSYINLVPLESAHSDDLYAISSDTNADERFRYLFDVPPSDRHAMQAWVAHACASRDPLFFAVQDCATQKILGRQALMRITPAHGVIEIGSIYWGMAMARTRRATEAFYLHARYVFDVLHYRRLEWKCDNRNEASKKAALRFGFQPEGVFRQHMWVKEQNRDTAWFAMLDQQWPTVKAEYERWLMPSNFDHNQQQKTPLVIGDRNVNVG